MLLLYNILITLLWPLLVFYPQFRGTLRQRLGQFELPDYNPDSKQLKVLINAVSAGEVVAISGFIEQLKISRPDAQIVLLTTTESGQEMARGKLADSLAALLYFPLIDLPFVVKRYLDRLKPDLYITTESEIWPNIQHQCRQRGIPVALVNARIYLHNKTGLRRKIVKTLYSFVDLLVCQDENQRGRFKQFGIEEAKLQVSGNIKFDFSLADWSELQLAEWAKNWGLVNTRVIVAGSTHPGEEQLLLNAYGKLLSLHKGQVKLVLAPRHIERTLEVIDLVTATGMTAASMTQYEDAPADYDVLVVDRYGVLVDMYRLASAVVMGGTFSPKVGGHNILEATALGKPVVIGPHVFSIENQLQLFADSKALLSCSRETETEMAEALTGALSGLISDQEEASSIGARAMEITDANRGSATRAVGQVLELLSKQRSIEN